MWNVHTRTMDLRTNNSVEGYYYMEFTDFPLTYIFAYRRIVYHVIIVAFKALLPQSCLINYNTYLSVIPIQKASKLDRQIARQTWVMPIPAKCLIKAFVWYKRLLQNISLYRTVLGRAVFCHSFFFCIYMHDVSAEVVYSNVGCHNVYKPVNILQYADYFV